jgi:hypothetical protein
LLVVVAAPHFDLSSGVFEREELMHVQALVAWASMRSDSLNRLEHVGAEFPKIRSVRFERLIEA